MYQLVGIDVKIRLRVGNRIQPGIENQRQAQQGAVVIKVRQWPAPLGQPVDTGEFREQAR